MGLRRASTGIAMTFGLTLLSLAALSCSGSDEPSGTVEVSLREFEVSASVKEVGAGKVRFVATNRGTMTHELAIISVAGDGQKRELADVEDIAPGKKGEFTVTLKAGRYELACLIAPGEHNSTVDHYQQGMHLAFTVR